MGKVHARTLTTPAFAAAVGFGILVATAWFPSPVAAQSGQARPNPPAARPASDSTRMADMAALGASRRRQAASDRRDVHAGQEREPRPAQRSRAAQYRPLAQARELVSP